jgi:hypothetical protein
LIQEDIEKMVEKKRELKGNKPVNVGAEKVDLIARRDAARDSGNQEEYEYFTSCLFIKCRVERMKRKIQDLEDAAKITIQSFDKTMLINQKHKLMNQETVSV